MKLSRLVRNEFLQIISPHVYQGHSLESKGASQARIGERGYCVGVAKRKEGEKNKKKKRKRKEKKKKKKTPT